MTRLKTTIVMSLFCTALASQDQSINAILMKNDNQEKTIFLQNNNYPPLAAQAKFQGDVIVAIIFNNNGKIVRTKSYTGAPPLRSPAEGLAASITPPKPPREINGHWLYFVTVQFKLPAKSITIISTPNDKIPLDQLNTNKAN